MKTKKLNPIKSFLTTILNFCLFKIHFPKNYNGKTITTSDNKNFTIFRHVIVGNKKDLKKEKGTVFIVKFKLAKMSVEKNKRFSLFPIPMFIGLPGFRAKFWLADNETGYNKGIYQWKTKQDAINYSQSFAVDFMTKRSEENTVSVEIIPDTNIYNFIQ
jgi:hypothetical protein